MIVLTNSSLPSRPRTDVEADEAVTAFAGALQGKPDLAGRVHYQPSWEARPQDMLDMVAFAWLNAPLESVTALEASLAPGAIDQTLKTRISRLGSSLDPMTVAIESNDVFGLTSAMRSGMDSQAMESMGGGGYANADGSFRVLYVDAPKPMNWLPGSDAMDQEPEGPSSRRHQALR